MPIILDSPIVNPNGHYADADDLDRWQIAANVTIFSHGGTGTARNDARIEAALTRADDEINQALRARGFAYPLASSHPAFSALTQVACGLALYWMFSPRQNREEGEEAGSDVIRANTWRRRAIDELNRILATGMGDAEVVSAASPLAPTFLADD